MKKIIRKSIAWSLNYFGISGRLKDLLMWPIATRLLGTSYTEHIPLKDGGMCLADMSDIVGRTILFYGEYVPCVWESGTIAFMKRRLMGAKTVFMAGAHLGFTFIHGASVMPADGRIYAFEPVKYLFDLAVENAKSLNGKVVLERKALGADSRSMDIHVDGVRSSLVENWKLQGKPTERIDVVSLDDYASAHGVQAADMIFLDVEGFELQALQGCAKRLLVSEKKPEIIFEIIIRNGELSREVCDFLRGFGYKFFVIEDDYALKQMTKPVAPKLEVFETYRPDKGQRYVNVFATCDAMFDPTRI